MPPQVKEVFEFLKNEVTWLYARWIVFEQLYRKSDLRLELLNEAGSSFFHMLQLMMYDDMQLALAKLTDDGRDTASLIQLQKRLESHANSRLAIEAKAILDKLLSSVDAIHDHRNKLLAHYSLDQATNPPARTLPDVYYQDIVAALTLVRDYMNLIEKHYTGYTQAYEHFVWHDDGDSLVNMLRWGIRHRDRLIRDKGFPEPADEWTDA